LGEHVGADLRVCPNPEHADGVKPNISEGVSPPVAKTKILGEHVGADLRVCPNPEHAEGVNPPVAETKILGEHVGADLRVCPNPEHADDVKPNISKGVNPPVAETKILGEHAGSPLHRVVQWFKTMTTNAYIRGVKNLEWQPFCGKLWQRNYYEHIIRNEQSYQTISNYILNNPLNWKEDKFYTDDLGILRR